MCLGHANQKHCKHVSLHIVCIVRRNILKKYQQTTSKQLKQSKQNFLKLLKKFSVIIMSWVTFQ